MKLVKSEKLFSYTTEILFYSADPESFKKYLENPKFYANYFMLTTEDASVLLVGFNVDMVKPDQDFPLIVNVEYIRNIIVKEVCAYAHYVLGYNIVPGQEFFNDTPIELGEIDHVDRNIERMKKLLTSETGLLTVKKPTYLGDGCYLTSSDTDSVTFRYVNDRGTSYIHLSPMLPGIIIDSIKGIPGARDLFRMKYLKHSINFLLRKDIPVDITDHLDSE